MLAAVVLLRPHEATLAQVPVALPTTVQARLAAVLEPQVNLFRMRVKGLQACAEKGTVLLSTSLPGFGEFPRLVGRYCSYLLPKQAG